jgi:hypothetical protein
VDAELKLGRDSKRGKGCEILAKNFADGQGGIRNNEQQINGLHLKVKQGNSEDLGNEGSAHIWQRSQQISEQDM